jgi:cell shape-determining protein MreC
MNSEQINKAKTMKALANISRICDDFSRYLKEIEDRNNLHKNLLLQLSKYRQSLTKNTSTEINNEHQTN